LQLDSFAFDEQEVDIVYNDVWVHYFAPCRDLHISTS
jgi:hypothetical protein